MPSTQTEDHRRKPGHTKAATQAHMTLAAYRAAGDPSKLSKAVRIVRAALADGKVTTDELTPLPELGSGDAK